MNKMEYWKLVNEKLKALNQPEALFGELRKASFDYGISVDDAVSELIDMRKLGMV